jgi:type IV secretion system protein VirB8
MNAQEKFELGEPEIADSWAWSVTDAAERSARRGWIAASIAAAIALLEAVALVVLMPLKTVEPYTLLVDRQTGFVEALAPLDTTTVSPDTALTRSFLVQYVMARESFYPDSLQMDYKKVSLWTTGDERKRYINQMQSTNPQSPLAFLPAGSSIKVEIRSISSLSADSSLVRFTTVRTDRGGAQQSPQYWASVINYNFSTAEMSEADRLINPLGFQVTRYRRDMESLPEVDAELGARVVAAERAARAAPPPTNGVADQ